MQPSTVPCEQARAGRPFTLAVRESISRAQGDDPLAAVTVVTPSNLAGLSLRRLLGSSRLDAGPTFGPAGIANVNFATPFQLASQLAATRLARSGRTPLTTAVLAAAVRHVLRTEPGRFGAVADHVATETALVRAYGELTQLHPPQRAQLGASELAQTAELLAFVEAVRRHLDTDDGGHHDEYDVFAEAVQALDSGTTDVGSVVLCGPFDHGVAVHTFLAALPARLPVSAVLGLTGDPTTDARLRSDFAGVLGRPLADVAVPRALPTRLVPAADPDEEVRAVVRSVLALARDGATFDRIGVFHPVRNPYARSLREQFDAAGIPSAGPDHRRVNDSMAGRLLSRILDLAEPRTSRIDHRLDRDNVLALAAAAPVRGPDGKRVRSGPWEVVSRKAGVVGGIDDWVEKLDRLISTIGEQLDDPLNEGRSAGFFDALARERRAATELLDFVRWIDASTSHAAALGTWADRSAWALDLLDALLPPANRRSSWPESEAAAADGVELVLRRVGVLDRLEPDAPWSAFVRAIELELDAPAASRGRFGTGVLVAPLPSATGLDLDHVFVVGLSEGTCPRVIREDTLLPDLERNIVGGALQRRPDRQVDERRRYLAALAAGSSTVTVSMPVGDHRNGRVRSASRWWVEALRSLGGPESLTSSDWDDALGLVPGLEPVRSFPEAMRSAAAADLPSARSDLELFAVSGWLDDGGTASETPGIESELVAGLQMIDERAHGFNRFTGDLSGGRIPPVIDGESAISASRLETWAGCPRRYFLGQHLGLGSIEAPDEIIEISALDRGSMWHQILEDFIGEALPGSEHAPATPTTPWTDADAERLHRHAERRFDEYEAQGRTGRPLLWEIEKEKLRADLDRFLISDVDERSNRHAVPDRVEMAIGFPDADGTPNPPAIVQLGDGRELRLRGFADRVDRMASDGSPVVYDYKTGSNSAGGKTVRSALEADPVVGGSKLQLGVYAEAAMQRYGIDRASAWYWFTSEKGSFDVAGYPWTQDRRERFLDTVGTIVSGIESGLYPPNPGEYSSFFGTFDNCRFCDFDRICRRDRDGEFDEASRSERLVDWLRLREPFDPDESTGGAA